MVNPYFHMFGLKAGILAVGRAPGATMLPEPVFDVDRALARVAGRAASPCSPARPRSTSRSSTTPTAPRYDLSTLRVAVTGAADIPVELIRRIDDELPFSVIITGYGLTEGGTASATAPGDDVETIATTVGRPRPGFELRIVDGDGQRRAGRASRARSCCAGGSVMSHYLDDPEATAEALVARRLAAHRRPRHASTTPGCLRIVGPVEGHVHRRRLQRLPGRDRERPARATPTSARPR